MTLVLPGRTAVITGAAGGIGRATALALARRQVSLALVDRDADGLELTAAQCADLGVRAKCYPLDLSDAAAVERLPAQVTADFPAVSILVNNAGVALNGRFDALSLADIEWLFSINFWGAVRMTHAFLPLLKQSDQAQLVAVSSLFGLIAPPGQTAYAASKFAVRGFFEALRKELADGPVKVTVVHPGGVATRIARDARGANAQDAQRFDRLLRMPADVCGERIATAIERRTERLIVGRDAKLAALIERLMPVGYWRLIGRHAQ